MTEPSTTIEREIARRIRDAGMPDALAARFLRQHRALAAGETGKVPWDELSPPRPDDIVDLSATAAHRARGEALLDKLVVIKLNGGLGTTMQLDGPKSLIPVREGYTFLELVARQVEILRERSGAPVPLVLMDSFATRDKSLALLSRIDFEQRADVPLDFVQHQVPRIARDTLRPLALGDDRDWAPPGHGDIYLALSTRGVLDQLQAAGYRWAFVSNVDNLAATVEPALLGYLDAEGIDFAMEVTGKTLADKKGGTLVRRGERLTLLERAQVDGEHIADFEDIETLSVFNTNSLWWRIDAVADRLRAADGFDLPLIVNPKTVDGVDVVQLEVAMGAAVGSFERAKGIRVPRSRFAPVKASSDLVGVASDAYIVDELGGVRPNPERTLDGMPLVELDPKFYKGINDLADRIAMAPSLVECERLRVEGDVTFSPGVVVAGDVTVRTTGQLRIQPGTRLQDVELDL